MKDRLPGENFTVKITVAREDHFSPGREPSILREVYFHLSLSFISEIYFARDTF